MYRKENLWISCQEVDPFYFDKKEQIAQYWPMFFHKTDKSGRPINIQRLGNIDVESLYKVTDPDYHWSTVLVNCECLTREVLPACRKATGNEAISGAYCIVDLKGFSISQFGQMKELAQKSFAVSQDYYPETMGCLRVINAPSAFGVVWKVVKHWLAKETQQKIDILGSDYEAVLLKDISPENLPPFLNGGKCTCGNCMNGAGPWLENRQRGPQLQHSAMAPSQPQQQVSSDYIQQPLAHQRMSTPQTVQAPQPPIQQVQIA